MNIAFISSHPEDFQSQFFGDAIRKKMIIRILKKLNHTVLPITGDENRGAHEDQGRGALRSIIKSRIGGSDGRLWGTLKDFYYLFRSAQLRGETLRKFEGFSPDLVYDFNFYLQDAGIRLAKKRNVPLILEVEGPETQIRYAEEKSFFKPYGKRMEIKKYEHADKIVTISYPMKDYLQSCSVPAEKIEVISNGADLSVFDKKRCTGKSVKRRLGLEKNIIIGFVGILSPWYKLELLVRAFANLASYFSEAKLLIIGDGVEREQIEEVSKQFHLEDKIMITGFVDHANIPEYLAAMDVCVIPHHQWWCSPLKLFEFGAMAKPVVAADVLSIRSAVTPEEVYFFQEGSISALTQALKKIMTNPALQVRLGLKLHERVRRDYRMELAQEKFSLLLNQVMKT